MRQDPFTAKHPFAIEIPFPNVDVAVVDVTLRVFVCSPPEKVEVPAPETVRTFPTLSAPVVVAFDEVAFPVMLKFPTIVDDAPATNPPLKREAVVDVALNDCAETIPCTLSLVQGAVFPMPTFPLLMIESALTPFASTLRISPAPC